MQNPRHIVSLHTANLQSKPTTVTIRLHTVTVATTYMPDQQIYNVVCHLGKDKKLSISKWHQNWWTKLRSTHYSSGEGIEVFCQSKARPEVNKAAVVSKCRWNLWTNRFQRNPHNTSWKCHKKPNGTLFSTYKPRVTVGHRTISGQNCLFLVRHPVR